ncbi:MAG: class I SAM-dependent methyltransferase [Thermoanaerobaculia bacterium]
MTASTAPGSFRLRFPSEPRDYLSALSQARWRREFEGPCQSLGGILDVLDPISLPAPQSGLSLARAVRSHPESDIFAMDTRALEKDLRWTAPPVSTLRELEVGEAPPSFHCFDLAAEPEGPPARYRSGNGGASRFVAAAGFRVLRVPEFFGPREEILERIPVGAKALLDVGCGAGETAGEARRRIPGLRVAGIDRHPGLADAARGRLDEFIQGEAAEAIPELDRKGSRFDTIILADFLEHTADPYIALRAALRVANPGATVIVSVPNASSLPILEDLLLGRFDPVAAGPEDAGHLRWFTRRLIVELLESAGLRDVRVAPVPVPSDGTAFLARLRASGIAHLPEELSAIQWIATATVPRS